MLSCQDTSSKFMLLWSSNIDAESGTALDSTLTVAAVVFDKNPDTKIEDIFAMFTSYVQNSMIQNILYQITKLLDTVTEYASSNDLESNEVLLVSSSLNSRLFE